MAAELRAAAESSAAGTAAEADALRAELAAAQAALQAQQAGAGEAAQRLADAAAAAEELQGRVAALEAELESQGQLFADSESKRAAAAAAVEQAANFAAHQQELMGQVEGRLAETEAEALALRQQLAERDAQLDGAASEAAALREVRSGCQCRFAGLACSWCRAAPRGGLCGTSQRYTQTLAACTPLLCRIWQPRYPPQSRCAPNWRPRARQPLARRRSSRSSSCRWVAGWLVRVATACTDRVLRHVGYGSMKSCAACPAALPQAKALRMPCLRL